MTRRVALLGRPLRRRHSQVMHDAAFAAAGIDARYELLELEPEAVPGAVEAARGADWLGLQVTAPYKRLVADLVDEVEPAAREIGAVNSVVRDADGRLVGFNTDGPGFRAAVELVLGRPVTGLDVVVAGAGGAAHAVVHALLTRGARSVVVGNRTASAAATLAGRLREVAEHRGAEVRIGSDGRAQVPTLATVGLSTPDFDAACTRADLVVNATTVGMLDPGMTIPIERVRDGATVFDLVYVPRETPLVAAARARGLRASNGAEMLVQQAAIAFQRWTGVGGMADVMRTAVAPLLADPAVRA